MRTNDASLSDTGIISAADASAAIAAFDYAAQQFESRYSDPIHVNIVLQAVPGFSTVGQSNVDIQGTFYTYAQIKTALSGDSSTTDDATAVSHLPTSDPTASGKFLVPTAQAKALRLMADSTTNTDGTFQFGAGWSYSFDPNNRAVTGKYDFIGIAMHEISEIMGRQAGLGFVLGANLIYMPYDLFRYTGPGALKMTGDSGIFFSVDGGNTLALQYNDGNNGGDPQDWASGQGADSFNAFGDTGVLNALSDVDKQVMDVIGYDRISLTNRRDVADREPDAQIDVVPRDALGPFSTTAGVLPAL